MKIFLICPVRNATVEETIRIEEYVEALEKAGGSVYWPARDTDQADNVGLRICVDNRFAIDHADEVHVWWNPNSTGSIFDFGVAFGLRKRIILANCPEPTTGKSFNNVLRALAE